VIGYLPEYRYGAIRDWHALSSHLTHLILFSIEVTSEGGLTATDRLPPGPLLNDIREATKEHETKLMVCIGGAGRSGGYAQVVGQQRLRKRFVEAVIKFLEKNDFDGVDLNWEQPQSHAEWNNFFQLVEELHTALAPLNKLITMPIHPGQEQLLNNAFINNLDLIHIMAYDQHKQHSTFQFFQEIIQQAQKIIPPSKMTIGIPFYGRHIYSGAAETYADIVKKHGVLEKQKK